MTEPTWIPGACTLPSRERPLRVAEFDALFANTLRSWERPGARLLRLFLDPGHEAELRDLTARETACCSFFTFTIGAGKDLLTLEISVPTTQEPVLDALSARLPAGASPRGNSPPPTTAVSLSDATSSGAHHAGQAE